MVPSVEDNAQVLFERWYKRPIEKLKELPRGDGAFVALMVACALYERYAVSVLMEREESAGRDAKRAQLASDFHLDSETARVFWDMIRNGLDHGAQPKARTWGKGGDIGWHFNHDLPEPTALERDPQSGKPTRLSVQPWKVADEVLRLWAQRPDLLNKNTSFPWGSILTWTA